ncbi:(2Fe-2S)-binding protein [Vibrio sp. HN007]|uniref:(2Fe-2S)-binding protein n=1 Tax=Vibrio iocasae TaxID=3098914 RepID=UPI0035D4FE8F
MYRLVGTAKSKDIDVVINGNRYQVPEGISVWSALALFELTTTRLAPVTGEARSAYCAMGVCFECLVEIDGMPNQRACSTKVQKGMRINRQQITESTVCEQPEGQLK